MSKVNRLLRSLLGVVLSLLMTGGGAAAQEQASTAGDGRTLAIIDCTLLSVLKKWVGIDLYQG
ncbi:MAG: hypothetical protein ABI614_09055 [Planctomycetota bacterium]